MLSVVRFSIRYQQVSICCVQKRSDAIALKIRLGFNGKLPANSPTQRTHYAAIYFDIDSKVLSSHKKKVHLGLRLRAQSYAVTLKYYIIIIIYLGTAAVQRFQETATRITRGVPKEGP
jgi:hypothetical protein